MIWIRKQIHILFLVIMMIVIYLSYALFISYNEDIIQQDVKVVAMDTYDHYARYTVRCGIYKFHFYDDINRFQLGDILYIKGDIIAYREQTVEFGFDLKKYYMSFHVYGKIDVNEVNIIDHQFQMFQFRDQLKQQISNLNASDYITAFIFGEKIKDEQTILTYANFDILYLFTISGLHIYVLMIGLKKFMFMFNIKSSYQIIITITVYSLISYLNLFSFVVLRLFVIYLIKLINKRFDMNMQNLDMIFLTFYLLILINIGLIYHQGFLITFLIIVFLELIHPLLKSFPNIIKKFLMSIAISIIILPFFQDIHIFQILMLPLIIIIITTILYPFAILTFVFPVVDDVYSIILNTFEKLILFLSTYQTDFFIPKFDIYQVVLYYASLIFICYANNFLQVTKRIAILILLMSLSFYVIKLQQQEHITFLDVGQGDTTIIATNDCKAVVDTFDGITTYLKNQAIYELDYLILTHGHQDHIKEAKEVMQSIYVKQVIISAYDYTYPSYEQNVLRLKANDQVMCGTIKFNFLGPLKDYENENNKSLVFQMIYNHKSFLFTGDIEEASENDLVDTYHHQLKSDVIKVPHHGSYTSSSDQFLSYVNPSYAIISLASRNSFGFPDENVINRYQNISCIIYRTDLNGTISYQRKNQKEKWSTFL
ncbi:MAG: ComEC family competence protein [Acholeplasmataceae bacterium]|nr:ComEC family competence protein [Acholeplasmataceae bacterium]